MKLNINPIALLAASLFGTCGIINATPLSWEDTHTGSPLSELTEYWGLFDGNSNVSHSGIWDLGDTFTPGVDSINGITVSFAFADDRPGIGHEQWFGGDVPEWVAISLGDPSSQIGAPFEVDGSIFDYVYYSLVLNPVTHAAIFTDLAEDGKLDYCVTLQDVLNEGWFPDDYKTYREDTLLKVAKIQASYTAPTTNSVPDGGTSVALLGMSLIGVAGLRGKFARANKA